MTTTLTMEEIKKIDYEQKLIGALELLPDVSDDKLDRITQILFEDE